MAKIPVGKTVEYAYGFTVVNFLTLLGLGWLGLAILGGGQYLIVRPYVSSFVSAFNPGDVARFTAAAPLVLVYYVVVFVLFAMLKVAFLRQALGLSTRRRLYYFSLGKPVWQVLRAYLLMVLVFVGIMIGFFLLMFILGVVVAAARSGGGVGGAISPVQIAAGLLSLVLMLGALFTMAFLFLRFGFLLSTLVVAEERISLARSWRLTGGNFWRMFAILLTIYLPLYFIYFVVLTFVVGINFLPPNHPGVTPEELAVWNQQLMSSLASSWLLLPFNFFFGILLFGLTSAASAFAYRALVPPSEGIAAEFA